MEGLDRDRFYVGDSLGALERRDQFNIIDLATGWKVHLMIRKDRDFSRSEFDRREPVAVAGVLTGFATPEDTVLAKLEWSRETGSDRQRRDVLGILAVQRETIDMDYLHRWARSLDLTADLDAVLREAALEQGD